MNTYKIEDLTAISVIGDLSSDSLLLIEKDGTQYQLSATTLRNYIRDGIATGDILTTTNTKTVTNKTFTSPKINEDVVLTAKSSDLNLLDGVTVTSADIGKLSGTTSNIKDSLNTINAKIVSSKFQSYAKDLAYADFDSSTRKIATITASDIKTELGLSDTLANSFATNFQIDAYGMIASSTGDTGVRMTKILSGIDISIIPATTSSGLQIIQEIVITMTSAVESGDVIHLSALLQRVNASNIVQSVAYSNDTQSNL